MSDEEIDVAVSLLVKIKHLIAELNPATGTTARTRITFVNQQLEE